jgi:hypothetical protein
VGINDSGRRRQDCSDALQRRLQTSRFRTIEHQQVANVVHKRRRANARQSLYLGIIGSYDKLPTLTIGHAALPTVLVQEISPADTEARLQGPGFVVDTCMNYFAIAGTRLGTEYCVPLDNYGLQSGLSQGASNREANDTGSNNHTVDDLHLLDSHELIAW